jgi:hypothetical protein
MTKSRVPTSNLKPLWHYPATDFVWFLVPVPSAKTLVLLLNKGTVALDTDTGSARWTSPDFRSAYAVTEGSTLYLWNGITADGFDLATGADTWTLTSAVGAPVAASGDVLCLTMGKAGSRMTGWSISRKQAVRSRPDQPAAITTAGGLVLMADKNEMQAVNCLDGTSKWTYIAPPPPAREVFATDADGFYCTMESPSTLYAGNLDDGTRRWSAKTPGERDIGAVTAADGTVFAVLRARYAADVQQVAAFNTKDGSQRWVYTPPKPLTADPPLVVGKTLVLLAYEGQGRSIVAVDLDNHRTAWVVDLPYNGPADKAPTVTLTTDGERLYLQQNADIYAVPVS